MSWHEMVPVTMHHTLKGPPVGKPFRLRFLGDVHHNAPGCDADLLNYVLKKWKADNTHCAYITMGDLDDFASGSERAVLSDGKIHESTDNWLDDCAHKSLKKMIKKCDFMRGKFLGSIEGNHKWEFGPKYNYQTSDQMFARELGGSWLGGLGIVSLAFELGSKNRKKTVELALAHGKAGGQLVGSAINQVAKMQGVVSSADIYVQGHNHKCGGWHGDERVTPKKIDTTELGKTILNNGIDAHAPLLCRSGSFLKMLQPGVANYGVKALYSPAHLGALEVWLEFRRVRKGGQDKIVLNTNGIVVR